MLQQTYFWIYNNIVFFLQHETKRLNALREYLSHIEVKRRQTMTVRDGADDTER